MSLRRIYTKQIGDYPKGFHVHHIKPRCEGGDERRGNLIALHPDDHVLIHKMRGDSYYKSGFLNMKGLNHCGSNNPNYGKSPSKTTREKMSKSHLGVPLSEVHKKSLSEALKGRLISKDHRKKLSISLRSSEKYLFIFKDGTVENLTQYDLRKKYDLYPSSLSLLVRGKRDTSQGWKLK